MFSKLKRFSIVSFFIFLILYLLYSLDLLNATSVFVLQLFIIVLQIIIVFFTLYQSTITLLGLLKRDNSKDIPSNPQQRFAVLVAAHNEEAVIGQSVNNLRGLDYPNDLYDVYVICDNCTDNTAQVVRNYGGNAMERHDPFKKGKGYGLEWMFKKLWEIEEKRSISYDAVVIFDADNLVSRNFLNVINSKLQQGFDVVQAYLDVKNPGDTWVTKSYAFAYWTTNRLFQLSREKLGLSAQLGGTGVVVRTKVLKEFGWGATSLTEDLEFTARYVLKTQKRCAWAHEAKLFDEKPLELRASWRQRIRWMAGHIDVMSRYAIPLIKLAIKKRKLIPFDVAIYLLQPTRTILSLGIGFFLMLSILNNQVYTLNPFFIVNEWVWILVLFLYIGFPFIALLLEKKARASLWVLLAYVFGLTWIPIIITGFFKRKETKWSHTKHNRTLSEQEIMEILDQDAKRT